MPVTGKESAMVRSQRACIAVEADGIIQAIKAEAKERQGQRNDLTTNITQLIAESNNKSENETRTKVAALFNTNRTYINEADGIMFCLNRH